MCILIIWSVLLIAISWLLRRTAAYHWCATLMSSSVRVVLV